MKKKYTKLAKCDILQEKPLIFKLIACAATICLIGVSINLYLNHFKKQKIVKSNVVPKVLVFKPSEIKDKVEKAGIELLKKKIDTKLSLEIRQLSNNLSLTKELKETRLILAKFLNWRLSLVKVVDLKQELELIIRLLDFETKNLTANYLGDYIGIKFQTIFLSNDFIQLERLRSEIASLDYNCSKKVKNTCQTQYDVVSFKLACLFGDWNLVEKFGKKVAEYNNIIIDKNGKQCRIPMMLRFEQDAHQNPEQQPNYYEIFSKRSLLKNRFESNLFSHFQFKNWKIISIRKNFFEGSSHKMQRLKKQYEKQKSEGWKILDNNLQKVWIYGGIIQIKLTIFGCSKVILCGPWNINEMFLSAVILSNISKQGMQMRLEFTLQLNRDSWKVLKYH